MPDEVLEKCKIFQAAQSALASHARVFRRAGFSNIPPHKRLLN